MSTKLNIGCGHKVLEGYINIDLENNWSNIKPDIAADVRKLPLQKDFADEAMAIHCLEHLWRWEVEETLLEWKRVLKPGGKLILEMPCLDKVLSQFTKQPISVRKTWWALYGDPNYQSPEMTHKWCYSIEELKFILHKLGFKNIKYSEPEFHFKSRDMRITARKALEYEYSVDLFLEDVKQGLDIDELIKKVASHYKDHIITETNEDFIMGSIAAEYFKGSQLKENIDVEKQPELIQKVRARLKEVSMGCKKKKGSK